MLFELENSNVQLENNDLNKSTTFHHSYLDYHDNNFVLTQENFPPPGDDQSHSSLDSSATPPDLQVNLDVSADDASTDSDSDSNNLESESVEASTTSSNSSHHAPTDGDEVQFDIPPDVVTKLLQIHTDHQKSGHGKIKFSSVQQAQIELITLLHNAHAPLYLIKSIWEWARQCILRDVDFSQPCSRKKIVKDLKERYGQTGICSPQCKSTILPNVQQPATVVKFDFLEQMYSLLSDDELMHDDNLLFRGDSPLNPPPEKISPREHLHDIDDGTLYRNAHKSLVTDPTRDVLCPIILFIDKTHCDNYARLTLEPISFTLGIFNKSTRRRWFSWRPLGYVVNFRGFNHKTADEKSSDYHHILSQILASLKQAQDKSGIAWRIPYRGRFFNVIFKIPVIHILGDTLGHDELCCHYTNSHVNYLCRYCDCPRIGCGIPVAWQDSGFRHTKQSVIESLYYRNDEEFLNHISYRFVRNAFWGVTFCDNVRGLHGSLPGELLHVFQHGLFPYARTAILKSKKIIKLSKRPTDAELEAAEEAAPPQKKKKKKTKCTHGYDPREDVMVVPNLQQTVIENDEMQAQGSKKKQVSPRIQELRDKIKPPDNILSETIFSADGCFKDFLAPEGYANISKNFVFGGKQHKELARQTRLYGRMLQHQSDREFESAYFPSGVGTEANVMGHEESSMLLLFLIVFCNKYGLEYVSPAMSEPRASLFILVLSHCLMLES